MTVFQRASQATHSLEGLERPENFTAFPEHTLLESGKVQLPRSLRLPFRKASAPIRSTGSTAGSRAGLVLNFAQF
jgi:hypothetical protein